jgi:succinyl-diaminopimelate desuccinylase
VIEFGPLNATIHKLNECVGVADIEPLKETYKLTLEKLLKSEIENKDLTDHFSV